MATPHPVASEPWYPTHRLFLISAQGRQSQFDVRLLPLVLDGKHVIAAQTSAQVRHGTKPEWVYDTHVCRWFLNGVDVLQNRRGQVICNRLPDVIAHAAVEKVVRQAESGVYHVHQGRSKA